jgi:RimJ/RimL family protein N-acetyltransferase
MQLIAPLEGKYLEQAVELYRLSAPMAPYSMITCHPENALAALTAPDAQFWVFTDQNMVIGLGGFEHIRPIDKVAEPIICVLPSKQNTGLGWKIGKFLFERIKTLNLRRVQSIVCEDSPTRKFLVKLGFKQEGTLTAMRLREGKPIDGMIFGWVKE